MPPIPPIPPIPLMPPEFALELVAWFAREGRDLPWRRTRDPYAILVSEIMLQQTQVATVIPFYQRWLTRFPDFATLAAADEQEVLAHWQGLGYYSRARNLHRTAQAVAGRLGGEMPRTLEQIRELPGIGRYTAGAVATFAFDLPTPAIDANIARVLARLADFAEPITTSASQTFLWDFAASLLPAESPGVFTGALMELGALLCTPRRPQCPACPVRVHCRASKPELLPVKGARRKTVELEEHCALILRGDHVLLERQTGPRWRGLWRLPRCEAPRGQWLHQSSYPFTHHRITLRVTREAVPPSLAADQAWFPRDALAGIPMTSPHRRALSALLADA